MIADKIKEQREELPDLNFNIEIESPPYDEVIDWHTNSIKQILQALIERDEEILQKYHDTKYHPDVELPIKDTIDYLKSEIEKI